MRYFVYSKQIKRKSLIQLFPKNSVLMLQFTIALIFKLQWACISGIEKSTFQRLLFLHCVLENSNCLANFELCTYFSSKYITFKSKVDTYVEVVPLALEFSRCVDFVSHDSGNGFLYIFHPFHHLGLPHKVHILDKRIIFLPERHLAARVLSACEFNILCKW